MKFPEESDEDLNQLAKELGERPMDKDKMLTVLRSLAPTAASDVMIAVLEQLDGMNAQMYMAGLAKAFAEAQVDVGDLR